jgi:hypothetical protein
MERNLREYMVSEEFAEVIENLLEKGFEPPLYFCAIAANGSMDMGSFEKIGETTDLKPKFLAQHSTGDLHALPIHMLFVDPTGAAARVVIEGSGEPQIIH